MTITALPTPPSRNDLANFAERGDAFLGALPQFVTEANALQADVNAKQAAAATSATNAATSATNAANSANSAATLVTAAGNSATAAATSATNASNSATGAANSAAAAAASETNAAASKNAAAQSATDAAASRESLLALSQSIHSGTVVKAVFYDTSKDSDGGAWRKRCQDKSWYNEALVSGKWLGAFTNETAARNAGGVAGDYYQNTVDGSGRFYSLNNISGNTEVFRGNRAEFPEQAAIIAEAGRVIIYDLTQSNCPMWMVFSATFSAIQCLSALNGVMAVGRSASPLYAVSFIKDSMRRWYNTSAFTGEISNSIKDRNSSIVGGTGDANVIVNTTVNDVAMTVLPDAPIDIATGLPIPTIAVATDGGISVIKSDGTVVNSASTSSFKYASITPRFRLTVMRNVGGSRDVFGFPLEKISSGFTTTDICYGDNEGTRFPPYIMASSTATTAIKESVAAGGVLGLSLARTNPSTPTSGMSAYITSAYNTGWMVGDIRGAWLADTVAGTVSNPATEADRSLKNNPLTVYGSITKSAVASGAQLVSYSGFSAANYLEQPYNANLDFGTGDFCFMGWANNPNGTSSGAIIDRFDMAQTGNRIYLGMSSGNWVINCGTNSPSSFGVAVPVGVFHYVFRRIAGVLSLVVNGVSVYSAANTNSVTNVAAVLDIGRSIVTTTNVWPSWLSLLRVSATAPSDDQLAHIYNTEKHLFDANAKCVIDGTSTAVTALAYDENEDALHVGTSWGRSKFRDLVRVESAATSVGAITSISAGQGCHITGGTSAKFYQPAMYLREELRRKEEARRALGKVVEFFDSDATTGQTAFPLPKGWRVKAVYVDGQLKRVGATKIYTVSFDGFVETVNFGVAPGNAVWVSIMAVRSN